MEEEPKYIFRITVFVENNGISTKDAKNTNEYFVKAFSNNDAIKRVILPNIGNVQIVVETICSTLDIIG